MECIKVFHKNKDTLIYKLKLQHLIFSNLQKLRCFSLELSLMTQYLKVAIELY